ncbi:MAG: rod shape-determining protein MreD [Clostridia bacterium]|nr:rod shape-determining protein MreD [Clostridia bacterium]
MRKAISIFILILTFVIIYFLQTNIFNWFTIAGVMPNLFIILVLFINLFVGIKVGIPFAVISGLYLDVIMGKSIGAYTIMFGLIAIVVGLLEKRFSKDSKITIILMVMAVTAIFETGIYGYQAFRLSGYIEPISFIIKLLIEIFYNVILTIILYPIMQKAGYKLESIFKQNEVLTRYF